MEVAYGKNSFEVIGIDGHRGDRAAVACPARCSGTDRDDNGHSADNVSGVEYGLPCGGDELPSDIDQVCGEAHGLSAGADDLSAAADKMPAHGHGLSGTADDLS